MEHLKLYEQFNNNNNYAIINQYINDKALIDRVMNIVNTLPNKFKNILRDFFSQKSIDVVKLERIEKRFNIFNKVKHYYSKGIKNINDLIDRILPKNEATGFEIFFMCVILIVVGLIAVFGGVKIGNWIENRYDRFGLGLSMAIVWAVLVIGGFFAIILSIPDKTPPEEKLKEKQEEISNLIIDTGIKEDTIVLVRNKDGKYEIQLDESNW